MKRVLGTLTLVLASAYVFADAPFTIFRPADQSRVRETVRVLIPRNAVPAGGYLGFFIGGKFVEATVPPLDPTKKYYEYDLDTKAKKLPDGKLTIEAVLYEDYQDQPRIVNRSSVEVTVNNNAESKIPSGGIYLRYNWKPGTESIYQVTTRLIQDTSIGNLDNPGARPNEVSTDVSKFRMVYATENLYPNGEGLIRSQAQPEPGKDYLFEISPDYPDGRRFDASECASVYQRLTQTGLEVFGSVPLGFPIEGLSGEYFGNELIATLPLPTLPSQKVHVGSAWTSRFQRGKFDAAEPYTQNSLVQHFISRGEFRNVEWEMGHPCARIVNAIEVAEPSLEAAKQRKENPGIEPDKIKLEETVWFALDRHQVVKVLRTVSIDAQMSSQGGFGSPGGGGIPGIPGGGRMGPGRPNGPQRGFGGAPGGGKEDVLTPGRLFGPATDLQKGAGGAAFGGAPGGQGRPPFGGGATGGFPGRGRGGGFGGGGLTPLNTYYRLTVEETFVLVQ
jgi:hypothetical protein